MDIVANQQLDIAGEVGGLTRDAASSAMLLIPSISIARQGLAYTSSIGFGGRLSKQGLQFRGAPRFTGIQTAVGRTASIGGRLGGTVGGGALLSALGMDPGTALMLSAGANLAPSVLGRAFGTSVSRTGIAGMMEAVGLKPPTILSDLVKGKRVPGSRIGLFNTPTKESMSSMLEGRTQRDFMSNMRSRLRNRKIAGAIPEGSPALSEIRKLYKGINKAGIDDVLKTRRLATSVLQELPELKGVYGLSRLAKADIQSIGQVENIASKMLQAAKSGAPGIESAQNIVRAFEDAATFRHIPFRRGGETVIKEFASKIEGTLQGASAPGRKKIIRQLEKIMGEERGALQGLVSRKAGSRVSDFTALRNKVQNSMLGNVQKVKVGRGFARAAGVLGTAAGLVGIAGLGVTYAQKGLNRFSDAVSNINASLRMTEFGGRGSFANAGVNTERQKALATMQYLRTGRDFIGQEARLIAEG